MDYTKIDAPLGAALAESTAPDEPQLIVFIHTARGLDDDETAGLESLGVDNVADQGRIITATLSPAAVDRLSHKPWVRSIKLSRKLRPRDSHQANQLD